MPGLADARHQDAEEREKAGRGEEELVTPTGFCRGREADLPDKTAITSLRDLEAANFRDPDRTRGRGSSGSGRRADDP